MESQTYDQKALAALTGKQADWRELAKDVVAFASAKGGEIIVGIADGEAAPPPHQRVPPELAVKVAKRLHELTVNAQVVVSVIKDANGGEMLRLEIPRACAVPSTTDGHYFLRIADESKPLVGDAVLQLATDRPAYAWETLDAARIPREHADAAKARALLAALRASDRVKDSVKHRSDAEIFDHYLLTKGPWLTNLGILCIGTAPDRASLATAPVIQAIKYDADGQKVNKWTWDDHQLAPHELAADIWRAIPDFREQFEFPDGLFRKQVPVFDETVVRELLVNALVHRPYTQRGDIFLNLHPDRLEIVNPGAFPPGVTAANILHQSVRRNDHLARLFHDLKLMEREGTGFDRMYEIMLSSGRPAPVPQEGVDRVVVSLSRRRPDGRVADLVTKADQHFHLLPRERTCLGLLAQHDGLTALDMIRHLELSKVEELAPWFGRLESFGLIQSAGRTKSTRYFIPPEVFQKLEFTAPTTLTRIEPHRLRELVLEDLRRYPGSSIGQIHDRIGQEIPRPTLKRVLAELLASSQIQMKGIKRWACYVVALPSMDQKGPNH